MTRIRKVEDGTRFHIQTDWMVVAVVLGAAAASALYFQLPLVLDPDAPDFNPVAFVPVVLCVLGLRYVIPAVRGTMLGRRFGQSVMEMDGIRGRRERSAGSWRSRRR